jgi:hypothetical protein
LRSWMMRFNINQIDLEVENNVQEVLLSRKNILCILG